MMTGPPALCKLVDIFAGKNESVFSVDSTSKMSRKSYCITFLHKKGIVNV